MLEDEPAGGEAVHQGARAGRCAVAAEVVRAQRVDQHDEDARCRGARGLPRAPALADEADVRPAGRAGERAGRGGLGREGDFDLAPGPRRQVHTLVEPTTVAPPPRRVEGAREDLASVDGDHEAHPGAALACLDAGREAERRTGGHVERKAQARAGRGDDGPPVGAARVTEVRGRLDAAQVDGGVRRLLHDRTAVECGGEIGDDLLDADLRGQAELVAAARREEAEEQCPRAARHERAATIA